MGWASGFQAGTSMGRSWLDAYERGKRYRAEEEVGRLGDDAEAVKGTGLKVTGPDGQVSTGVIDPGTDYETIRQQYEQAGYKAERMDQPQFAARQGEGRDLGVYDTEQAAEAASRKANYGLTRQRAGVYERTGDMETARGLRRDAQQMKQEDQRMALAEKADARADAGEKRADTQFKWVEQEKLKVDGMTAAAKAYATGDWDTLSKIASNVWGDQFNYQVSPDGKAITKIDKATGQALGTTPMPTPEAFQRMLLASDSKNWLSLTQMEQQQKNADRDFDLRKTDADRNYGLRKQQLAAESAHRAATLQQGRMGSIIETTQGLMVPTMVNGRLVLNPVTGADGQPLRKPVKLEAKDRELINTEVENILAGDPTYREAKSPALKQRLREAAYGQAMQNLGYAKAPAAGPQAGDPYSQMFSGEQAPPPRAGVRQPQGGRDAWRAEQAGYAVESEGASRAQAAAAARANAKAELDATMRQVNALRAKGQPVPQGLILQLQRAAAGVQGVR